MSRLPSCTAADVIRALKRAGFTLDHATGSHHFFRHPQRSRPVPVPVHRGDIKRGLLYETHSAALPALTRDPQRP
jgi:predicted RNA binding protein YcfA (HicA-like mRNA interferase family)